jgi:hypothetical protein
MGFLLKVGVSLIIFSATWQCVILHFGSSGHGATVSPAAQLACRY